MATMAPTSNGVPTSQPSQASQSQPAPAPLAVSQTQAASQPSQGSGATQQSPQTQPPASQQQPQQATATGALPGGQQPQQGAGAPRPRDSRTMELLLTAQGVQSYEARVPLFLLDFAYRHTTAILSDALHLAADPNYLTGKSGGGSGGEPVIKASAVQTAIASRLAYQFRGGGGTAGGGGASKDWMLDIARERNKVALPRINTNEWGVRLPNEKFVLSGVNWGLKEVWAPNPGERDSSDDEDEDEDEGMEGLTSVLNANGDGKEVEMDDAEEEEGEGTYEDVFGRDADGDAEMS